MRCIALASAEDRETRTSRRPKMPEKCTLGTTAAAGWYTRRGDDGSWTRPSAAGEGLLVAIVTADADATAIYRSWDDVCSAGNT